MDVIASADWAMAVVVEVMDMALALEAMDLALAMEAMDMDATALHAVEDMGSPASTE